MVWSNGSIIPNPPLEQRKVITSHLSLDQWWPSVFPDHKKFQINLCICKTRGLEKIQQDKTYHVVANKTWLATIIRSENDNLIQLHNNNFFLNWCERDATWFYSNNWQWFGSRESKSNHLKLNLFKIWKLKSNRQKWFKTNHYKKFKLKPNGFRDFQTFKLWKR